MRKIGLIFGMLILLGGGNIKANEELPPNEEARIYTRTGKIYHVGDCIIYELHYFDDNGTPYDPHDDAYLGMDYAKDC